MASDALQKASADYHASGLAKNAKGTTKKGKKSIQLANKALNAVKNDLLKEMKSTKNAKRRQEIAKTLGIV